MAKNNEQLKESLFRPVPRKLLMANAIALAIVLSMIVVAVCLWFAARKSGISVSDLPSLLGL